MMALLGGLLSAHADSYTYLNVETTSGTVISIEAASATITFADGYLLSGTEKIAALTELSKMYFSNEKGSGSTGISSITSDSDFSIDQADAIYDLSGRQVDKSQVKKGVYIVKKGSETHKMQVR